LLRLAAACLTALGLVLGLFHGLEALISAGIRGGRLEPPARIEFQRLTRVSEIERKTRYKPERQQKPQPEPSELAAANEASASLVDKPVSPVDLAPTSSLLEGASMVSSLATSGGKALIGGGSDHAPMPLVRIQPEYPPRARARGIEGYVVVEFTITTSGSVRDPIVLDAQPTGVFDKAALRGVVRWKFSPQVENGEPMERRAKIRLDFVLAKDKKGATG
jgi:protein TonB